MSIATKNIIFFILAISITSDINLPLSPLCLFLAYAVCCEEIKSGKTFFSFCERASDIFLDLHLTKKWVSYLWISFYESLMSVFFSINLMIACLSDMLKWPFSLFFNTQSTKT